MIMLGDAKSGKSSFLEALLKDKVDPNKSKG